MTEPNVRVKVVRKPSDEEADLIAWFEKQEEVAMDNLDAGAKQIITLVTTFLSIVLGALALGKDSVADILSAPVIIVIGTFALMGLFVALACALWVVMPLSTTYREASLNDLRKAYNGIRRRKSGALTAAFLFFAGGLCSSACFVLGLLGARV